MLFGATGFTGRLTAADLVASGERPLLVGRDQGKLDALATSLDGAAETAVANVEAPHTLRELLSDGDVLISTVGPFARWGDAAARAAIDAGVHYLDSTGEPVFIRRIFEHYGAQAAAAGCGLLTAFGFDYVPGALAASLALRDAGDGARGVDIGYFLVGDVGREAASGGTLASMAGIVADPGFAWRGGALVTTRTSASAQKFRVDGSDRYGVSVPGSEHFTVPRVAPDVRDVGVYLGAFGKLSRPMAALAPITAVLTRIPGTAKAMERLANRVRPPGEGPSAEVRARQRSWVAAVARDAQGAELATVDLAGPDPYDLTAAFLAWGAITARDGAIHGTGALGPVEAFGLDPLAAAAEAAGLRRT